MQCEPRKATVLAVTIALLAIVSQAGDVNLDQDQRRCVWSGGTTNNNNG
jgi:hypothetical protein